MKKIRRCLKFTTYIFIPNEQDDWDGLRDFSSRLGMGRLEIFDEYNDKVREKSKAFANIGQMMGIILKEYQKRALKRVPTAKQRKRQILKPNKQ